MSNPQDIYQITVVRPRKRDDITPLGRYVVNNSALFDSFGEALNYAKGLNNTRIHIQDENGNVCRKFEFFGWVVLNKGIS